MKVEGCTHATVGNIVRGNFNLESENHGKPVYKKDTQLANGLDVMLYYWDDRDGPNFCGWWFGPKVGGDQVWAYHPESEQLPPTSGWKVPYDGPVDESFKLIFTGGSGKPKHKEHREGKEAKEGKSAEKEPKKERAKPAEKESKPSEGRESRKAKEAREREAAAAAAVPLTPGYYPYGFGYPPVPVPVAPIYDPVAAAAAAEADRQLLESSRKRQEEQRRKDEVRKREEAKKKREEDAKKREEEAKKKKEAEDKKRAEQKALLAIRKVIQKVRLATPENFEELNKELQDVLSLELENTGSQRQKMSEETEKGLEMARKRIEQISEQRKKEQERKNIEDEKRNELEAKAKVVVKELEVHVCSAENTAERLKAVAEPLSTDKELSVAEVEEVAKQVEDVGAEAKAATKICTDFILAHGADMKEVGVISPNQPSEAKQALAKLLQRINECTKLADATVQTARGVKDKAARRAAAREKTKQMEALFEKYDRDADDLLSKTEVIAYAKSEFNFTLDQESVAIIFKRAVEEGQNGVPLEKFHFLKLLIGIARERQRDLKRKHVREEKEDIIKNMKVGLQEKIKDAGKAVEAAEKEAKTCDEKVEPLTPAKASKLFRGVSIPEQLKACDEADGGIEAAKAAFAAARKAIDSVGEGLDGKFEADMKAFLSTEAKQLELRMGRLDRRIVRAVKLASDFREKAIQRRAAEVEKIRFASLQVLHYNRQLKQISMEELFDQIDTAADGVIDEQELSAFFNDADKDVKVLGEDGKPAPAEAGAGGAAAKVEFTPDVLTKVFSYLSDDCGGAISKESFSTATRLCYRVVKEAPLCDAVKIAGSKTLLLLKVDEVVELVDGPVRESAVGVLRIQVKAPNSSTVGWVTIAGNQGTVFLTVDKDSKVATADTAQ